MSKRTAIIAVMGTIAMSIVFLISVSTIHLRSSSVDREFKPPSTLHFNSAAACVADTSGKISLTREQWDQCLDPGAEPTYYLSIVIVTRMDDYAE